tara:strand:- start:1017 stop:1889 length:873 start_codon:yes stop_codon:yes gene_type:complete
MPTIPYIRNYSIKPHSVSALGVVTFTDGTNEITPNQQQCEAYGYTYNQATGTCSAFRNSDRIGKNINNTNNNTQGSGNSVQTGTNNTYIMGENNTVRGLSRNNIIGGVNNEIQNNINNTTVFGVGGDGLFNNAMIFGGNNQDDRAGTRQTMTLMYGGQTTNNSTVDIYPNNGSTTTISNLVFFQPQVNRVYYFQSETMAVRVGGTSGSGAVGDFKAFVERGVVKCTGAGTLSIDRSRSTVANTGTTSGWVATNAVSGSNFQQTVKGANNMTLEWVSTIRFMQLFTGVTLP